MEIYVSIFLTSALDGSGLIRLPVLVGGAQKLCGHVDKSPCPMLQIETDR
jgi:hypothetical protein